MTTQEAQLSALHDELRRLTIELDERGRTLTSDLKHALLSDFDTARAESRFGELTTVSHLRQVATKLASLAQSSGQSVPLFVLSPSQVYGAYQLATASTGELLHYSLGYRLGDLCICTRIVPLELDASRVTFARADLEHSTEVLIDAEQRFGEQLIIYWHAHPSSSNHPSSIDLATQRGFERGGYTVIGGIFSRSGHLRFFSDQLEFEISIIGKGVRQVGDQQYQLTQIN